MPPELGLTGRVFSDFGSSYGIDQSTITSNGQTSSVQSSSAIRVSAGTGVAWKSPFGPIRLDMAVPLKKEDFDKREFFRVGFGTRF